MQVNKNTIIAGVPAITIRKLLRGASPFLAVAEAAGLIGWKNIDRTTALLNELVALGYFAHTDGAFGISERGRAVRDAKWVDQPTRAMAEKLLQLVIETAETVNSLPEVTHYVSEMYVVGSFLEEGADVKKLEIVVRLEAHTLDTRYGAEDTLRVLRRHGKHVVVRLDTKPAAQSVQRKLVFSSQPVADKHHEPESIRDQ
jgi:hypothetical protein